MPATLTSSATRLSRQDLLAAAIRYTLKVYLSERGGIEGFNIGNVRLFYNDVCDKRPHLRGLNRLYLAATTAASAAGTTAPASTTTSSSEMPAFYESIISADSSGDENCFTIQIKDSGNTLLHCAVEGEEPEIALAKWLLRHNASYISKNDRGIAPVFYMLKNQYLFEVFYRAWLIKQPLIAKKLKALLAMLKAHWESYDRGLKDRENTPATSFDPATRRAQRRRDLNEFKGWMSRVEIGLYPVWNLITVVERLQPDAFRGWLGRSELYDKTMPLIEGLQKILDDALEDDALSKIRFFFAMNSSLESAQRELCSRVGVGDPASLKSEFKVDLPTDRDALIHFFDVLMIKEAMLDEKLRQPDNELFYEKTWGKLWACFEGMIFCLYREDASLTARETRSAWLRDLLDNPERLAADRVEWRFYKRKFDEIFGKDVFEFVIRVERTAETKVICSRDNPADEEVLVRYLKFRELAGSFTPKKGMIVSGLRYFLTRHWHYAMEILNNWYKSQLDDAGLVNHFKGIYKKNLRHLGLIGEDLARTKLPEVVDTPLGTLRPPMKSPLLKGVRASASASVRLSPAPTLDTGGPESAGGVVSEDKIVAKPVPNRLSSRVTSSGEVAPSDPVSIVANSGAGDVRPPSEVGKKVTTPPVPIPRTESNSTARSGSSMGASGPLGATLSAASGNSASDAVLGSSIRLSPSSFTGDIKAARVMVVSRAPTESGGGGGGAGISVGSLLSPSSALDHDIFNMIANRRSMNIKEAVTGLVEPPRPADASEAASGVPLFRSG